MSAIITCFQVGMENLNPNSAQVSKEPESKVDDDRMSNTAMDKLNPDNVAVKITHAGHDQKEEDQSEFCKPWLDKDSTSKLRTEEVEKIIECLNQKQLDISMKLEERKIDRNRVIGNLTDQKYFHRTNGHCVACQQEKLEPLQLALDKLSFKNNAYQDRAIKSFLYEDEIDLNNLQFRMLHGSNSLAEEKRLLRDAKKNRQKEDIGQWSSTLEELNKSISLKFMGSDCYCKDEVQRRKGLEEMKQLKCLREKAIANAAVKGRIWNSLGSKEAIRQTINQLDVNESEELRQERLAITTEIKQGKRNLKAIERDTISLQRRLTEANQKKSRAYKFILQLKKQQDQTMAISSIKSKRPTIVSSRLKLQ